MGYTTGLSWPINCKHTRGTTGPASAEFTPGGLYVYIYGNFSDILLGLADKVGEVTNAAGEWVYLNDFQSVKLSDILTNASSNDTDNDGLTDEQELGTSVEMNMLPHIGLLAALGL